MAHINLLPWRQELRKEKQKQFFVVAGLSVVLAAVIVLAAYMQMSRMISGQEARNNFIKRQITEVEQQLKEIENLEREKDRLLARMKIVQELQSNRPEIVRLFDEVARIVPDGVYLKSLAQKGRTITVDGQAQSNARVSSFMRNIEDASTLQSPLLEVIETDEKSEERARNFKLKASQESKTVESEGSKK
ncbi:MAG: PilN domain-containing protein [Pseudomonadota bacterium]|nr:MAG: PilN domain-containing protein [Pseudomonadota bacterium]